MKVLTCGATLRRLQAFHDEELQVDDQIAVSAHLAWCDACAARFADLGVLREALRAATHDARRAAFADEDNIDLQAAVVGRLAAERTVSFSARVRDMFEDMHLVYAGLAATMATLACVVAVLTMTYVATKMRPHSLGALVNILESPGSNQNPVPINARVLMPRALDASFTTTTGVKDGDMEFMLAAIVTREGTVQNLELLHATNETPAAPGTAKATAATELLGAVSRTRFEPARVDGLPVAVNMVWVVANTTVRASKQSHRTSPAPKKRLA